MRVDFNVSKHRKMKSDNYLDIIHLRMRIKEEVQRTIKGYIKKICSMRRYLTEAKNVKRVKFNVANS